ncbi:rho GTPase-activating protein 20-like [Arapaima gigas]
MTPQEKSGRSSRADSDEGMMSLLHDREKASRFQSATSRPEPNAADNGHRQSGLNIYRDGLSSPSATSSSLIQAFLSRGTVLIMDDHAHLTTGLQTQERHLFLFSDTLVVAKAKSSSSLKLKQQVRLCEVWLSSCVREVAERKLSSSNSFVIGWPTTNCVVTLSSSEAKEKWLSALQWHIHKLRQEEHPNKIAIRITLLAAGDATSTTTVQVSNTDTAEMVVKAAAEKLGLSGRPTDRRLWVFSGKEEPPYPLIGHERPFSIAMNCLRDSVDQPHLANNNILAADGTLDLDQLPKEQQVQFILKLRPSVHGHIQPDSFQKHFRRKRSLIDWALRRGNASRYGGPSDSSTSPRKLFGHPLTSVCHNGHLPKPILDMLYLLYHEGPKTKGIFRRSANAKTCKELKERLNSGDAVEVEGESVFVAASVITDFLRNVPGSVLSTELYEKWMEVLEVDRQDEKNEAIKGLLDQLPEANVTLLRHLFGLLHHIQENSEENQMNAVNLALCIAPNMLWLPSPAGPEEESRSTRKVAILIQTLIENTPAIFGNELESLFTSLNNHDGALEDVVDDYSGQLYSSDEFDSEQERPKGIHGPERSSCFLEFNDLFVKQEKEIWSLLDEMDIFTKQRGMEDNTYSCEDLEDVSFCSSSSVCSLMEAQGIQSSRSRCSSEPSVCQSSQLHPHSHAPVARQSSCDAAVMRGQAGHTPHMPKLRLEGSRGPAEDSSPRISGRPKYAFWRSPQIPSRFRNHAQKLTLSSRSSFSSLSSTATSPSVSSISSLDSTFSYCSDSMFSPGDVSALPFLFGTSARLHPSEGPTRFPKDWTPSVSVARESPRTFDWCNEYDEQDEDNTVGKSESHDDDLEDAEGDQSRSGSLAGSDQDPGSEADEAKGDSRRSDVGEHQVIRVVDTDEASEASGTEPERRGRKTSVKHIQLTRPESSSFGKEKVKRTKITFYIAPNTVTTKEQVAPAAEGNGFSVRLSKGSTEPPGSTQPPSQMVQVHIPQTVFYGQSSPLVLQSVSTRPPTISKDLARTDNLAPGVSTESSSYAPASSKTLARAGNTIKHTIRIRLPAAVKSTVKEYFSHADSKGSQSDAKAVEKELLRSRLEWQSKCLAGTAKESMGKLSNGEESFV